jgi:hypothetical protein
LPPETQVAYKGARLADNLKWLREVTPLSKLEKPA